MTEKKPIFIVDDPSNDFTNDFVNAFRTKAGKSDKSASQERDHRFKNSIQSVMLHQIHPFDTWLIDEVHFNMFLYVFFVEANTRYLFVVQGNSDNFTPNAYEQDGSEKQISGQSFYEAYNQFVKLNGKAPKKIILDSALAHDFKAFRARINDQNVIIEKVIAKDNHIALSILDRVVATIRRMCEQLQYSGTPPEMIRVAAIYNNTKHGTLTKALGKATTPADVHNNRDLETRFLNALRRQNIKIQSKHGYKIPVNSKVIIRNVARNPFQKSSKQTVPGNWLVIEQHGNRYLVENDEGEQREVMRRDIKIVYSK